MTNRFCSIKIGYAVFGVVSFRFTESTSCALSGDNVKMLDGIGNRSWREIFRLDTPSYKSQASPNRFQSGSFIGPSFPMRKLHPTTKCNRWITLTLSFRTIMFCLFIDLHGRLFVFDWRAFLILTNIQIVNSILLSFTSEYIPWNNYLLAGEENVCYQTALVSTAVYVARNVYRCVIFGWIANDSASCDKDRDLVTLERRASRPRCESAMATEIKKRPLTSGPIVLISIINCKRHCAQWFKHWFSYYVVVGVLFSTTIASTVLTLSLEVELSMGSSSPLIYFRWGYGTLSEASDRLLSFFT